MTVRCIATTESILNLFGHNYTKPQQITVNIWENVFETEKKIYINAVKAA